MNENPTRQKPVVASVTPISAARAIRRIPSSDLFGDVAEVVIEHNGRLYLLRKQPLGGLVLTGLDRTDP